MLNLYKEDPGAFNDVIKDGMKYEVGWRWFFNDGIWKFGVTTPADLVKTLLDYDNTPSPPQITSTVLVMDGEDEIAGKGQAKAVYDVLLSQRLPAVHTACAASLQYQNGTLPGHRADVRLAGRALVERGPEAGKKGLNRGIVQSCA